MSAAHDDAYNIVLDDAYEYAAEEGYIHWIGPTLYEPGYWSDDVDVVMDFHDHTEDEDAGAEYTANVTVRYGRAVIAERQYEFNTRLNGSLDSYYEEV